MIDIFDTFKSQSNKYNYQISFWTSTLYFLVIIIAQCSACWLVASFIISWNAYKISNNSWYFLTNSYLAVLCSNCASEQAPKEEMNDYYTLLTAYFLLTFAVLSYATIDGGTNNVLHRGGIISLICVYCGLWNRMVNGVLICCNCLIVF